MFARSRSEDRGFSQTFCMQTFNSCSAYQKIITIPNIKTYLNFPLFVNFVFHLTGLFLTNGRSSLLLILSSCIADARIKYANAASLCLVLEQVCAILAAAGAGATTGTSSRSILWPKLEDWIGRPAAGLSKFMIPLHRVSIRYNKSRELQCLYCRLPLTAGVALLLRTLVWWNRFHEVQYRKTTSNCIVMFITTTKNKYFLM